jgi:class 3 adenylate cyclase
LYVQLFGAEGKSHGPERPRDLENVEALLVELRNKRDREMDLILREQIVEVETQTDPVFISASSSDVSSVDSEEYEPSELSDAHDPFADESEPGHGLSIVVNGMAGPTSFGIGGRRGNGTPNSRRSPAGWMEIPSFAEEQKKQRQRASKQRHVGLQVYPPREDAAIETGSCSLRSYEAQTSPRLMRSMFPQFARTISWDVSEVSDVSTLKKAAPIDRAVSDERALAEAVAEKERAIFGTRTRIEQEEELLHAQMENELMKQEQLLLSEKIRNEEDAKWRPQVEYLQKQLDKANADIQRLKANTILPVDLLKSLTDNGDDVGSQLERVEKQFAMREREIERITRQLRAEKEAAVASLEAELVDARRRVEVARATMDPVSEEYALLEDEMQTLAMRLKLYKEEKPSEEVPIRFPSGDNIAIVFTDVENSTTMWEKHTKAMYQALKTHNRILRSVLFRYDGYAVKFEGDGSMLSFHTPLEAVRFCMEFQDELLSAAWPEEILKSEFAQTVRGKMSGKILFRGLRVRCGLHVGEPICAPDLTSGRMDYFGPMVNKAARVSSAAHGGQILCSHAAWLQVRSYQQQYNFVGRDLKVHKLKGIEGSERIFQIASTDLFRRKFPPIRTEDTSKTTTNQELLNKYQLLSQKIGGLKVQMHSVGAVLDGVPRTGMQKRHPLVQECIKIEDSLTSLSKRLQLIREEKAIWQSDKTTPPSGKGIALVFTGMLLLVVSLFPV